MASPLDQPGDLSCPLCRGDLHRAGGSLRCPRGHTWDIAAKGYVNFVLNRKPSAGYGADSFRRRRRFLEAGHYDHIVQAVLEALEGAGTVVDAGCGEGHFAIALQRSGARVWGLDYSKESISLAAGQNKQVGWLVGDLARMPLKDGAADAVLNAFTPANYGEFARVLKPGGLLVKVVPGAEHLKELRLAAADQLQVQEHSPQAVAEHFARHFQINGRRAVSRTVPLEGEALEDLLHMTPLLFSADPDRIDRGLLPALTLQAEVLVGQAPHRDKERRAP